MRRDHVVWVIGAWGLLSGPSWAQQRPQGPGIPAPRISVVSPAGGRAGGAVEVTVTGTDLDDPERLIFSHPGIEAKPLGAAKAPEGMNRNPRRGMQATGPVSSQKFRVSIPPDTPAGLHDVRLVNRWGVSNPRAFAVGALTEVMEKEPNNDVAEAQRIALGSSVNGAISSPTDVDDFVFEGKKGQRVLVSGLASSLDSRLLLALQLFDASGRPLAANHEYRGTDALLDVTLPGDGDYLIRAFGFTYTRGDAEHFYRLTVSTGPWVDAVFPPVIEPGATARVTVFGRNLPGGRPDPSVTADGHVLETMTATVTAPKDPQIQSFRGLVPSVSAFVDGFEFRVRGEAGTSNPYLLALAGAPVVLDRGGNDTVETAQEVSPPCEIAGWIERPRDLDWYAFEAKKGDVLMIEAFGERLGSPLDLFFALRNGQSRQMIGEFDEENVNLGPNPPALYTRTDDPARYRFVAPADGRYQLLVSSREAPNRAGPRHLYTARITREEPDFRLVIMPESSAAPEACVVGQGGRAEATVIVARQDGFNGPIRLSAEGLPEGVTCPPQVIGTGQKQGVLVLSASTDAPTWAGPVTIKGAATIGDREVVREARAATITWPVPQPNVPPISRLDRGFFLAVRERSPVRLTADVEELTASPGEKLTVPLTLNRNRSDVTENLQSVAAANLPPALLGAQSQALDKNGGKLALTIKPNAPAGVYSLVVRGQVRVPFSKDPASKQKTNVVITAPTNPVLLTIRPK